MARWMRLALGAAFLMGGGALLFWSVARNDLLSSASTSGLSLLTLVSIALGLAALGASADLFGLRRQDDPPPKTRNTGVYGAAEPAPEVEAAAVASGKTQTPLSDQSFSE